MSPDVLAGHHHVYQAGTGNDPRTLLLLHGTGGNEHDLIPLARTLAPDAALLSPRGRVLENGMPRFFRRHGMGVLDVDDLKTRAGELVDFVKEAADTYGFDASRVVAVGYSNGANIASSVLIEHPGVLAGAALARAMVPYEPEEARKRDAQPRVILLAGRHDPYTQSPHTENLARILETVSGANVDVHWADAGHELTPADVEAARAWLAETREVHA